MLEEDKTYKAAFLQLDVADASTADAKHCKRIVEMINEHEEYKRKMEARRKKQEADLEKAQDRILFLQREIQDLEYDSSRISNQTLNVREEECRRQIKKTGAVLEELEFLKEQVVYDIKIFLFDGCATCRSNQSLLVYRHLQHWYRRRLSSSPRI